MRGNFRSCRVIIGIFFVVLTSGGRQGSTDPDKTLNPGLSDAFGFMNHRIICGYDKEPGFHNSDKLLSNRYYLFLTGTRISAPECLY